jgi:predicted kinase
VPTLTLTRGLPASGKTTWAKQQRGHVRVNRDELRRMLHGGPLLKGWAEAQVTLAQRAQVEALLGAGINVICDDTNLRTRAVRELAELGWRTGAEVVVHDFTDVSVDECVARDATRPEGERVGEKVIRDMWQRYLAGRPLPLPVPDLRPPVPAAGRYQPPAGAPEAFLVDIDGTVAITAGRSPYDETRVGEDTPNEPVVRVVQALSTAGYRIVFCSGRTEACRDATAGWLATHVGIGYDALHMRPSGDKRKDTIIKAEIFDKHIRYAYRIVAVLDDRAQVVRMWRALGLTVLQVAEGAF